MTPTRRRVTVGQENDLMPTYLDNIIANAGAVKAALPADRHNDVISVDGYARPSAQISGAPLPGATFRAVDDSAYPLRWEVTIGGVKFVGCLTYAEAATIPEAAALLAASS